MKKCPFCKKEIHDQAVKCPHCHIALVESIPHSHVAHVHAVKEPAHQTASHYVHKKSPNLQWKKIIRSKGFIAVAVLVVAVGAGYAFSGNTNKQSTPVTTISVPQTNSTPQPQSVYDAYLHNQPGPSTQPQTPSTYQPTEIAPVTIAPIAPIPDPPAPATYIPSSLPNGTVLKRNWSYLKGDGELSISNGTDFDAVAKLILYGSSVYTVYIKAHSKYTISSISDGDYSLVFALGNVWDSTQKVFLSGRSYEKFDDPFSYVTTTSDDGEYIHTHYASYSVTLNPVIGGNAQTNDINADDFNAY